MARLRPIEGARDGLRIERTQDCVTGLSVCEFEFEDAACRQAVAGAAEGEASGCETGERVPLVAIAHDCLA
jgi:hypothetical protein